MTIRKQQVAAIWFFFGILIGLIHTVLIQDEFSMRTIAESIVLSVILGLLILLSMKMYLRYKFVQSEAELWVNIEAAVQRLYSGSSIDTADAVRFLRQFNWPELPSQRMQELFAAYTSSHTNPRINPCLRLNNLSLVDADFSCANLAYADFRGSDISGVDFRFANLSGANLIDVKWSPGNPPRLGEADITGAQYPSRLLWIYQQQNTP